jgi:Domain of unknown function (DUF3471)
MHIRIQNDRLVVSFGHTPTMVWNLQHWQYDTFKVHWQNPKIEDAYLTFALTPDGRIDGGRFRGSFPGSDLRRIFFVTAEYRVFASGFHMAQPTLAPVQGI